MRLARYFATYFKEIFCRFTVYPNNIKYKILGYSQSFLCYAERESGRELKPLYSDGGKEYLRDVLFCNFKEKTLASTTILCIYSKIK